MFFKSFATSFSQNVQERVDGKERVDDNSDQESIQRDLHNRFEYIFQRNLSLEINSHSDSSDEKERNFQVPVDLLFGKLVDQ